MAQLTITTLPDDLAQRAEAYARETGRSLESLLETYLQDVVQMQAQAPSLSSLLPATRKVYEAAHYRCSRPRKR